MNKLLFQVALVAIVFFGVAFAFDIPTESISELLRFIKNSAARFH
jgi:hypothetical protein